MRLINKPWGQELWWAYGLEIPYVGKILTINPRQRLSLQYHSIKHETIYVMKGKLYLDLNGKSYVLWPGESLVIPPGTVHRFAAKRQKVILLEASTLELDDTIRIQDDYGRATTKDLHPDSRSADNHLSKRGSSPKRNSKRT